MPEPRRITLLTDFGTADGYVAAMKGVIANGAPHCIIDDAAHDIAPGDVEAAAWSLGAYWRLYPPGTIHVVVVDPGVGSARHAIAAEVAGRYLVGPDNGVFSHVLREVVSFQCVAIAAAAVTHDVVSATFHGRDIFAPAAARLAGGADLRALGTDVRHPVILQESVPHTTDRGVEGRVVHVDRFGNLVTNVPLAGDAHGVHVRIRGADLALVRTYADVGSGQLLALRGSRGTIEIAVRDGSAREMLGAGRGERVVVSGV